MSQSSDFRSPPFVSALATALLLASEAVIAAPTHADSRLQLAYTVSAKQDNALAPSSARTEAAIDAPLRLEYELTSHIDRMTQTTAELRTVIDALPGPGLPAGETTPTAPGQYATPLEETLARLKHVEQLMADLTQVIKAMPFAGNSASPPKAAPQLATAPKPKPAPRPALASDTPASTTTIRSVSLLIGAIIAVTLALYLRRRFLRRQPSRKELAATIESPPLRDEALELADIMTSMGLVHGAAQALVERIRANPRQALSHWLKLLEVYRQTGQQAEFENAAREMRSAFNVRPGAWEDEAPPTDRGASLENYPHIAAQLKRLWPAPASCSEYLLSLLADNRDGKRAGFPLPVVEEIVLLLAVLRYEEQPGGSGGVVDIDEVAGNAEALSQMRA